MNRAETEPGVYITHNAAWLLSDITWGSLSDYMQLPLDPEKALHNFPRPVNTL